MNKIIEELPKNIYGKIIWDKIKNKTFNISYNGNVYEIHVLSIKRVNKKIKVVFNYNGNIFTKDSSSFKDCKFHDVFAYNNYLYEIGDIVDVKTGKIEILKKTRLKTKSGTSKAYVYKCLNDGVESESLESNIAKGQGCAVCVNQRVVKGVNDISTTHKWCVQYFKNKEDAYKYSYGSEQTIIMKCPDCGEEREYSPNKLTQDGFKCRRCGDGISRAEKLMHYILTVNNIDFQMQHSFEWSKKKRYDFYIPELNMLIETHGIQHYKNSFNNSDISLKEIQDNDKLKKNLALENNIENYIEIDCRGRTIEDILDRILNSEIKKFLTKIEIDILEAKKFCATSTTVIIANFKNSGMTRKEIVNKTKISEGTVIKHLILADELGLCNYKTRDNKKKVNSEKAVMLWLSGERDINKIASELKVSTTTARTYLIEATEQGKCDYSTKETRKKGIEKSSSAKYKRVKCVTTGEIFNSQKEACKYYSIHESTLTRALNSKNKIAGKHPITSQPLLWERVK